MPSFPVLQTCMAAPADPGPISVEVCCALPSRQELVHLHVPADTRARQAVVLAGFDRLFPELDMGAAPLAIFGALVADDHVLSDGDRVVVLRPLQRDPREARRMLAASGRTMGSGPANAKD